MSESRPSARSADMARRSRGRSRPRDHVVLAPRRHLRRQLRRRPDARPRAAAAPPTRLPATASPSAWSAATKRPWTPSPVKKDGTIEALIARLCATGLHRDFAERIAQGVPRLQRRNGSLAALETLRRHRARRRSPRARKPTRRSSSSSALRAPARPPPSPRLPRRSARAAAQAEPAGRRRVPRRRGRAAAPLRRHHRQPVRRRPHAGARSSARFSRTRGTGAGRYRRPLGPRPARAGSRVDARRACRACARTW